MRRRLTRAMAPVTAMALVMTGIAAAAADQSDDAGLQVWVSTSGDDQGAGDEADPLASLSGARDRVRELRQAGQLPAGPVTIVLREGTYELAETVAFGELDSGTADAPVTITAHGGEEVRIDGGATVPGSAAVPVTDPALLARLPVAARPEVVQLDLAALGIDDLGEYRDYGYGRGTNPAPAELFVDGEPMSVAAWPNDGDVPIGTVLDPGSNPSAGERDNRGAVFEFDDPALDRWAQADQMFVSGFFWHGWAHDAIRAAAVDTGARTLQLASATQYSVRSGQPWSSFRVSNLLEEIDQPGEYFIDHETRLAYLYPPGPLAGATVQVSLLGTPMLSFVDASHLRVEGLTFENSRGMAVYIEGGSDVVVAGNTFRNLGEVAVSIGQGATPPAFLGDPTPRTPASNVVGALQGHLASNSTWNRRGGTGHQILSNDVVDTGSGGILAGAGDRATLTPAGIRIANNDVRSFNRWLTTSAPGIWINGAGLLVEHNLVRDAAQRALFVNGNLHTVRLNEIYDAVRDADDVGAVGMYRDPSEFGNLFEHNFIHDNGSDYGDYGTQGIFLDDGTSGQIVRGNVFVRAGSNFAVKLHGGRHNQIENNIFVDTPTGVNLATWTVDHWKEQLNSPLFQQRLVEDLDVREPPFSDRYPTLATYIGPDGSATDQPPNTNVIADNVAVRLGSLASSTVATFGDNYVTDADPGFADPEAMNYALSPDSVVYDELPGFEPIPFDQIGLFTDEYRASTDPQLGAFGLLSPSHGSQNVDPLAPPDLTWQPSDNAESYRVQVSTSSDFSSLLVDEVVREPTFAFEQTLAYDTVYHWRVRAESMSHSRAGARWNDGGNRAFRTRDVAAVPAPPVVSIDATSPDRTVLSWEPVAEATEYVVLRRVGAAGQLQELTRGVPTTFTDVEATPLADLSYTVVAANRLGRSDPSAAVAVEADVRSAFTADFSAGLDPAWYDDPTLATGHWQVVGSDDPALRLTGAAQPAGLLVDAPSTETFAVSADVAVGSFSRARAEGQYAGVSAVGPDGGYLLSMSGTGHLTLEGTGSAAGADEVSVPYDPADGAARLTLVVTDHSVIGLADGGPALELDRVDAVGLTGVGVTGAAAVVDFDDVGVETPRWGVLPPGWQLTQYGPHEALAAHDAGTWTIRATGEDVFGTRDEFGFVYQPVSRPDGGRVTISARVESLEQIAATTLAGVMIRAEDTPEAANVFSRTVAVGSNQTTIRATPGDITGYTSVAGLGRPIELKLVWEGTSVTSYYRRDGGDWTLHTVNEIELPDDVMVGLAVSARHPELYTEAVMTNVQLLVEP
ncbi:right-handed parallel beta-helix repeat-containing protein [Jiangella muralis]|uniref:right-handed parallel beta-helix repeat-containing protein n=1 Tax=Jiangella muralis TaxID=702383 RepID=UPI0009F83E61|nr:right-handed parallel beta-helix repeat-containing protein [Jiangella muralis]